LIAFVVIAAVMPKALSQLTWGAVPGAIAYAAVMLLFVLATKLTTAANAVFLHYTAPIHIALIGPWLLGERTRWRDWVLIAMALGGVALFFCDELDLKNRWGLLAGLGSGFCSAWLIMLMRRARRASPEAVTQLGNLLALAATSPWLFPVQKLEQNGLWLLMLGGVSLGVPYLLYSCHKGGEGARRHINHHDRTDFKPHLGHGSGARIPLGLVIGGRNPGLEYLLSPKRVVLAGSQSPSKKTAQKPGLSLSLAGC